MEENHEIIKLLQTKQVLEHELNTLVYGAIEIRQRNSKKYIYTHYRENGMLVTKYVGEYNDEVYNLILKNNIRARQIKKAMKETQKKLKELNYVEKDIDEKVKSNIDFAKRNLVDTIYKQAILEGVATTYADTESIIEGGKVNNMTPEDIMKIVNLKHAWEFILNKNVITSTSNFNLLCEINKIIEEGFYYTAGKVRNVPVNIKGTKWRPEIPLESTVKEELEKILNQNTDHVSKATEILLYLMKRQVFIDGNKRTAGVFVNHYLIKNAKGIIAIPTDKAEEFKQNLILYYEGKDEVKIKRFIKEKCYTSMQKEKDDWER